MGLIAEVSVQARPLAKSEVSEWPLAEKHGVSSASGTETAASPGLPESLGSVNIGDGTSTPVEGRTEVETAPEVGGASSPVAAAFCEVALALPDGMPFPMRTERHNLLRQRQL